MALLKNQFDSVPIMRHNSKAMPAFRSKGTVHALFTAVGIDNEDTSQPKARTSEVLERQLG